MNDEHLLRYSRHILLPQLGIEGQQKFARAHALIVGAGGLGAPAAMYLAAAGVGALTICDDDDVDLTNLQRQIVHRTESIGLPKALSASATLAALNPEIKIYPVVERAGGERLKGFVSAATIVLDCSDNFATRHAINRACVSAAKPLVSGAAVQYEGQVMVFDPRNEQSSCYCCVFPENGDDQDMPCAVMGVFAPLVGMVGSIQAAEALKLIAGIGKSLSGELLLLDALHMEIRAVKLKRDLHCAVCATRSVDGSGNAKSMPGAVSGLSRN